jgi:hypothetical protein
VSLKAELNGTRHNTKSTHNTEPTPKSGKCKRLTPRRKEVQEVYDEEREVKGLTSGVGPRSTQHNERLTPRSGEVQEAYAEEREVKGLTSGVGLRSTQHNERLTPRSGEVQEAYAEERGSAGS